MPSRLAVRAMRQAISPRLAIRTERNTKNHWVRIVPALASGGDESGPSWTGAPVAGASVAAARGGGGAPAAQTGSSGGAGAGLAGTWAAELLAGLRDFLAGDGWAAALFA